MPVVLRIDGNEVTVGFEDGSTEIYDIQEFNYHPNINDQVRIYGGDMKTIALDNEQHIVYTNKRVVNKVAYILLAFLLGNFGIHEFYAGYTGKGIVCLIFCWTFIPGLIAIVKAFKAACTPSDEFGNILV